MFRRIEPFDPEETRPDPSAESSRPPEHTGRSSIT